MEMDIFIMEEEFQQEKKPVQILFVELNLDMI
jgi:hypothetical protein